MKILMVLGIVTLSVYTIANYNASQHREGLSLYQKSNTSRKDDTAKIAAAYKQKRSNIQVYATGKVIKILPDDNRGSRHQKFIIKLKNNQTLLIAHNIDLAPRIVNLKVNDMIEFFGEYEYNAKGGVIHWTHHDPNKKHKNGWIKHKGTKYQ